MDAKEDKEFTLSKSILTDGSPVRSLAYLCSPPPPGGANNENPQNTFIISGTEEGIISTTDLTSFETNIHMETTKHEHHITALKSTPNDGKHDFVGYATGCKDALVRIFNKEHKLVRTLAGHEKAVTSLSWLILPSNTKMKYPILISGSWDGTARLWDVMNGSCIANLTGHENTVNVLGLPPLSNLSDDGNSEVTRIVTGSAGVAHGNIIKDHKIRIWNVAFAENGTVTTKIIKTIENDHVGPIRGLAFDSLTAMVYSCSNDGSVKVRDALSGECVTTLESVPIETSAQPPMLLDVVSLNNGMIAACSEDGNAFVWNMSRIDKVQIIPHPNCVWAVDALPNGDLVTACHDGNVRIFTLDATRHASARDISALSDAVMEARSKSSSGPSAEEISKLPRWEEQANHVGRSDGQVQVFSKSGKAIAAQWSAVSRTWIEVGEVMGKNDNTGTINGVRYDHIFPIEVDVPGGGVQNLQIGYNSGENPFTTAQNFIDEHMLDQGYLAQIADYIRQRVGQGSVPSLGGSADVAMTSTNSGNLGPAGGPSPMNIDVAMSSYKNFPMISYKYFDVGADSKTLHKIMGKIREFNSVLNNNLSPSEIELLDGLCSTISATNRYHATSISDAELKVIQKMTSEWSISHVFPALDLARMVTLHPDASKSTRNVIWNDIIKDVQKKCRELKERNMEGTPSIAIPLTALRLFANCFRGVGTRSSVTSQLFDVLKCTESFALSTNKNVRLALSTTLLNSASFFNSSRGSEKDQVADMLFSSIVNILKSDVYEAEAIVRAMVALGTLLLADDELKERAKELNLIATIELVSNRHGQKASAVASELKIVLQ